MFFYCRFSDFLIEVEKILPNIDELVDEIEPESIVFNDKKQLSTQLKGIKSSVIRLVKYYVGNQRFLLSTDNSGFQVSIMIYFLQRLNLQL